MFIHGFFGYDSFYLLFFTNVVRFLKFEVSWALTNIASGTSENTKVVIDHGAILIFVRPLGSPSDDVHEQVYTTEVATPRRVCYGFFSSFCTF